MGGPRRLAVKGGMSLKQAILTCTISGFGKGEKARFGTCLPLRFTDVRKRRAVLSSSSKMVWCVAIGCKNSSADRKKRGVSFHRFPKAKGLQKRWVAALKLKRLPERFAETGHVCSEHFVESDFKRDLEHRSGLS